MTRRKRTDGNQTEIVEGLRKLGVFVEPRLSRVGEGVPDLLYCHRGKWGVAEVKLPNAKLTKDERRWWDSNYVQRLNANWTDGWKPRVWRSLDDARRDLGL